MGEPRPDDPRWLAELVARSTLIPEARLRRHWQRIIPFLSQAQRYELAATLLEAEAV